MHVKCKDWRRFKRKQRLQKCPNGQVMAIFGRSPKTCIFGKKAKVRPRETFKKSPRKYPSLQRAKSTLAKMSLSCNLYPLILQRLEKILAHKAALGVPEWPSYGNFCKVTQNPHFLKKCKGKRKRNFWKITQKVALAWKAKKDSGAELNYTLIKMHLKCQDLRRFWHKQWLQKCPNGQVMVIIARSPKTRIFWKSEKGGPRQIFQKSPKK